MMVNISIEIEDEAVFSDSVNNPYRMKLFTVDKGPE